MKIAVIGGGISGLATAFNLVRRAGERDLALDLTLIESGDCLGGKMRTIERDGYRCEVGPNGWLDSKPFTMDLVEALGLTDQLLRSDDSARRRFVVIDGALKELPTSPPSFLTSDLLTVGARFRVIREMFV